MYSEDQIRYLLNSKKSDWRKNIEEYVSLPEHAGSFSEREKLLKRNSKGNRLLVEKDVSRIIWLQHIVLKFSFMT